ncbi:MAG: hypothetical protein ABI442_13300 [Gemmatimonadaceae bacterium]
MSFQLGLRAFRSIVVLSSAVLLGCGAAAATGVASNGAAALIVVQGDAQLAQAGRDLGTPIVLRAIDAVGNGVPHVTVTLYVAAGGGTVTPASDTTDSHGEFHAKWTLGPNIVSQEILASVVGANPVSLTATGLLPSQIILVQGNNQSAKVASAVSNSIIVRVVGPNNIPMQGVTVGFQVLTGGGGMTPATVITNALGEASTKWTLGTVGANTASAASGSLPPVTITATATP